MCPSARWKSGGDQGIASAAVAVEVEPAVAAAVDIAERLWVHCVLPTIVDLSQREIVSRSQPSHMVRGMRDVAAVAGMSMSLRMVPEERTLARHMAEIE